jgi:hypothetical protein
MAWEKMLEDFFNLPIPGAVWEEMKIYQDADFVRFVDAMSDKNFHHN